MSKDLNTRVLKPMSRRQFTQLLAAAPVAGMAVSRGVQANDMPLVDPESAVAQQLQYVSPSETEGQSCENCMLYVPGEDGKGTCPLFSGSMVPAEAWCNAWVAKA